MPLAIGTLDWGQPDGNRVTTLRQLEDADAISGRDGATQGAWRAFAVVSGPRNYDTCLAATGYVKRLRSDEVCTGTGLCARTFDKRHALVLVRKAAGRGRDRRIDLGVTVWDLPYEE